jgi:type IV pilus assembly protein PilC
MLSKARAGRRRRSNSSALGDLRFPGFAGEMKLFALKPRIPAAEVVMFARSLAMMTGAGLPVLECFRILAEQTGNHAFKEVIRNVARNVAEGMRLAAALEKHPKVFDTLFVRMVAAGEAGGVLPELLGRVAGFVERSVRVRKKIKSAMIYPAMISAVATVTIGVLLVYVIPVFAEVYAQMGKTLPVPTRITITSSQWLREHLLLLIVTLSSLAAASCGTYKTKRGRELFDAWLLSLPIIGELWRKMGVVRFAHNMAALLGSGITALDSLSITAGTLGNKSIESAVLQARDRLTEGETLARPLAATRVFPALVCQLIAVGENTGALDRMLRQVGAFYEEEVDRSIAQLVALMEPAIMIVLAIVLGGIVVSMYLPIFQMGSLIQ